MVTIGHTIYGDMFAVYGGYETSSGNPPSWWNYPRITTSGGDLMRTMLTSKVSINTFVIGNSPTNTLITTIDNNIVGILYKTNQITKMETFR